MRRSPEDDPLFRCLHGELGARLAGTIDHLPERERLVVTLYYYEEMTMSEIGLALGVVESRVSQIHSSAVVHLRARFRDLLESDEFEEALAETGVRIEREKENAAKASLEFLADNKGYLKSLENDVSRLVSSKTIHYRNRWYDENDGQDEIYIASVQDVYDSEV